MTKTATRCKRNLMPALLLLLAGFFAQAQIVAIPDANFKNRLVNTPCAYLSNAVGAPLVDVDANNDGEIDVAEAQTVYRLGVSGSNIVSLEGIDAFSGLHVLNCSQNHITSWDFSNLPALTSLTMEENEMTAIALPPNIVEIDLNNNHFTSFSIPDTCPSLSSAWIDNNFLQQLSVTNTHIVELSCAGNQLSTLDVSEATDLQNLKCDNNQLTSLIIKPGMGYLNCSHNLLTSLDWAGPQLFFNLIIAYNQLTEISIPATGNYYDAGLDISGNLYTSISLPDEYFGYFNCSDTHLVSLDMPKRNFGSEQSRRVENNLDLQFLNLKNGTGDFVQCFGSGDDDLTITGNSALQVICLDDFEMTPETQPCLDQIAANNNAAVRYTTYCTFEPGGDHHLVTGSVTFDCGGQNIAVPNAKIAITGGFLPGQTFTDANGHFLAYCGNGNVTIAPQLENPLFTVTPASVTQVFAGNGTQATANFCISAAQAVHDLEVSILPLTPARPGFNAVYKVVLQNNGTQIETGNLSLSFDDAVLDFVSASPNASQTAGSLAWAFTNLSPLQRFEFNVTLNLNAPSETPSVNIGDVLSFSATASIASDATQNDNMGVLSQTVVGSNDPNDKTVHEGATISPAQVGDYLHYTIRFQNTGNYAAQNVVVKDMLAENLDKSTLQMVAASHPYRATMTDGNKLEFFFENIELPAEETDEPNSQGFVSFKIKPMSNVALNDVMENTAHIFFDYNAPVTTNTVATTVSLLATPGSYAAHFDLWPNPASNEIKIRSSNTIDKIEILNSLGQNVVNKNIADNHATIDVSGLPTGVYYASVTCGKTKSVRKLVVQANK